MCTTCHFCSERCPQGIDVSESIIALRNLAAQEDNVPEDIKNEAVTLLSAGVTVPPSPMIEKRRDRLGLPKLPQVDLEQVQTLLKATGLFKHPGEDK